MSKKSKKEKVKKEEEITEEEVMEESKEKIPFGKDAPADEPEPTDDEIEESQEPDEDDLGLYESAKDGEEQVDPAPMPPLDDALDHEARMLADSQEGMG